MQFQQAKHYTKLTLHFIFSFFIYNIINQIVYFLLSYLIYPVVFDK